ncbi:MAG: phage terminase large subunit [Proteobacteria bacterium]|nr:phage terminase large subunit [Pseudomonadota bacterium]
MQLKLQNHIAKELYKNFKSFVRKAFAVLHSEKTFLDNWHIDLICQYLEALQSGKIKRLIINMPPRHLKSICTSVAWPAWILSMDATAKIIVASHSQNLSTKHSIDCRNLMQSTWYKAFFPQSIILKGANTKQKFSTMHHGCRIATSVGSSLIGEGADYIVIDDPITPEQSARKLSREKVVNWFKGTIAPRLNNKKLGKIVLVMQRLHQDDLSAEFIKNGQWEHLKLPAISDEPRKFFLQGKKILDNKERYLHQDALGERELEEIKKEIGSFAFAAQYQQEPYSINSGIIKSHWIKIYKDIPYNACCTLFQSWDCAIKSGIQNDYTVCTTWKVCDDIIYLVDVFRARIEYPRLKKEVMHYAQKFNPEAIIIEDHASGQQVAQELENKIPIIKYRPKWNKEMRLLLCSSLFESGKIMFPEYADWLFELKNELFQFPHTKHDDQVDSITQFLHWYKSRIYSLQKNRNKHKIEIIDF